MRDRDDDRRGRDRDDDRRGRDRDEGRGGRDRDERGGRDRRDERDERRGRDDRDDRRGSRDRDEGSGSSRGFRYQSRSADETRERGERGANDFDKLLKAGVPMWKPNDGENRIRILPATWDGSKHYGLDVKVHYGVGPDRGSYLCPRKHGDGPCPICEERDEARQENDPDEEYVKELEAKSRVLIYLVDRDHEKEGVQAWFMPWGLDKDITKISVDKDSGEVLPVDHPEEGYDVMFDKSGQQKRTKYEGVSIARRSSPLGKSSWLDYAMDHPLPDQLQVFDYDHIAKAFGAKGQQRDTRGRDDRRDERDERDDRRDGRARDDDRGRDSRDDRGRDDRGGSSRSDDRGRERGRDRDDEPTWDSVHRMTRTELEDLVELKNLPVKPREAKDDEDLADWVCEEMGLKREERRREEPETRRRDEPEDRLADMRRRRAD